MRKNVLVAALVALIGFTGSTWGLGFTFPAFDPQDPIQNKFADVHFFAG